MSDLTTQIKQANEAYRAGNPIMSDNVYDRTLDELRRTDPDNNFLHQPEPEKSDRRKVKHSDPMLSTEKAYTFAEIEKFIARCEAAAREIGLDKVLYALTPKLDGMAAKRNAGIFEDQLISRGDGEYGFDISDALSRGIFLAIYPENDGPGEIVVYDAFFQENLKDEYSHPRNVVSGLILSTEENAKRDSIIKEGMAFVGFHALRKRYGKQCCSKDISEKLIDALYDKYTNWVYPIDGLVLEVINPDLKKHLGSTSHHHRWQIAFKRKGETAETTVQNIRWQVGRTGVVTPVIEIESVIISGATINNVTGHNAAFMESNSIGVGTRLRIIRSGEVIPKVDEVIAATLTSLPKQCPECFSHLVRDGVSLVCNSNNCVARQCRKKEHFFKTLDIKGFGPSAVEKLATVPLNHLFDQMDVNHYVGFGFGLKQSVNLNKAIQSRKAKSVNPARFLKAFGIHGLGESTAKKILAEMNLDEIILATPYQLAAVPSVGEKTAHAIAAGLQENLHLIQKLKPYFKFEEEQEPKSGSLAGFTLVFSGKMEFGNRKDMQNLAKQHGADVHNSITAATTHLVCGASVGKAKTDKAAKLKVMVLSEENFMELVNG